LAIMALSAVLVSSCLCLVLADWICQPLGLSDGSCNLHEERTAAILLVVCLMTFSMVNVAVAIKLFLEPLPLWEPAPRMNNKKLYVDEDAVKYYWHVPSTTQVRMIGDGDEMYQHLGASEKYGVNLKVEGEVFEDNKLLRVQEPGQQRDIERFTWQRKNWLLKHATQDDWFELALRFSKELTPYAWKKQVRKHPKWKMVKLCGFDGGRPLVSGFANAATNELLAADVVIWDGDWFCMEGWTGMIHTFLNAKKDSKAVAFQKRAEVPGFHRSYWELYKKFPNRIQVVILKDAGYVCPKPVLERHNWLEDQFKNGKLERPPHPDHSAGPYNKYLTVAMVGRRFQGEIPVIAMSGGKINTALAAVETGNSPFKKIHWTVYEGWRGNEKQNEKTLFHYASESENQSLYLTLHTDHKS